MLSLILIYFVGKAFYDLASKHKKSSWGFAVLGVVSYYAGILLGGMVIVILFELLSGSVNDISSRLLGLMGIPVGISVCWGFYKVLQNNWSNPTKFNNSELSDGDLNM